MPTVVPRPLHNLDPESGTASATIIDGVSVVVPAYNEERGIRGVVRELRAIGQILNYPFEILIVDDGSTDRTIEEIEDERRLDGAPVRVVRNDRNRGYGYSLKRGIREARHNTVIITDGDGTYPNERIPDLVEKIRGGADMAVGARALSSSSIAITRKPAKWMLNILANFLAGRRVPDYNSGLRAMRRDLVEQFEPILPDGFSFTTTITLAALTNSYEVEFVPIEYAKRKGESKIRPIRDTMNFVNLIVRTVLYFRPLKVFVPLALLLYGSAFGCALRDMIQKLTEPPPQDGGHVTAPFIGDVTVVLFLAGLHLLVIGFLADLACEAIRPAASRRSAASRAPLYEKPLGFLMTAAFFLLLVAVSLTYRDKVSFNRQLAPKTLAVYVSALQFFSAGLLADLLQRRGRLR